MSCLLIEALKFVQKGAERNTDRLFTLEEIASQLNVSPKTVRYYRNDFLDTGLVDVVSADGKICLRALLELLNINCDLTNYRQGATKSNSKVPYNERIPIMHIRQFYDIARKQSRNEEEEKMIDGIYERLLHVGERTTVYSRGSAGKWLTYLDDLRKAVSISEKIIAIGAVMSFIHGRGRIAPLIVK